MRVLVVKTNNVVRAVQIITQGYNEVPWADLRKLMPYDIEPLYINRISRLAFLYLMFVEKGYAHSERPINKLATQLINDPSAIIRGDVVIARTDHLGDHSKILALEEEEIQTIAAKLSKVSGAQIEVAR